MINILKLYPVETESGLMTVPCDCDCLASHGRMTPIMQAVLKKSMLVHKIDGSSDASLARDSFSNRLKVNPR